jgi:hypothetical protein
LGHIITEILEIFGFPKEKNKKALECGAKERELSPRGSMTHTN